MNLHYIFGTLCGWGLVALIVAAHGIDASERYAPQWVKLADLLARYNVNDYAASVKVYANVAVRE